MKVIFHCPAKSPSPASIDSTEKSTFLTSPLIAEMSPASVPDGLGNLGSTANLYPKPGSHSLTSAFVLKSNWVPTGVHSRNGTLVLSNASNSFESFLKRKTLSLIESISGANGVTATANSAKCLLLPSGSFASGFKKCILKLFA